MAYIRNSVVCASLALAAFASPAMAEESSPPAKVLGPLKAGIFRVGTKQALAYYEGEKDTCKVTVLLTDPYDDAASKLDTSVRFKATVSAGTSTRVETNQGSSLALTCAAGATTLFVEKVEQVAYVAPAK